MNKENKGICFVFGASEITGTTCLPDKNRGDFVIAADGGLHFLNEQKIVPDLTVGDFDSFSGHPESGKIVFHPPEKDSTDTALSVAEGIKRGFNTFVIYGGLGGRLGHTLANIQLLCSLARDGYRGYLTDGDFIITAVRDGGIGFPIELSGYISVFCQGETASGVELSGLKYPLNNARLTFTEPLGVSNEFTGKKSSVFVKKGVLSILWHDRAFSPGRYTVYDCDTTPEK